MRTRYFSLVWGVAFLLVGIAGFIPGLVTAPTEAHNLSVTSGHGRLFGLFPVNVLHNIVHLLFGVWGIAAYRSFPAARTYARSVGVIYIAFAVMGLIPVLNTTFGLVPLHGHDVWLHLALGGIAAYFGFARADAVEDTAARPYRA